MPNVLFSFSDNQTEEKALSNMEIASFKADILVLHEKLHEIAEKSAKNKDTLEKLQESGNVLDDRQSQMQGALDNNSFVIVSVNKTLQTYSGYVNSLQQDTNNIQTSLQNQMHSHNVVVMNLNNLNQTQVQQRGLISALQRSVDDTSQAIQKIKNDFQNLQQVFLQATKDTDWLKEKVQNLQTLAANNSALAKANNDTLEDMSSQLSSFSGQMDNITAVAQANEQSLKDLQDHHKEYENRTSAKFNQKEQQFQSFETDIVNIISNISYTAHHLRTLTSNLNDVRTTCTDTLSKHTDELTFMNNTLGNIRLDAATLRMQQDVMRTRLDNEVANLSVIMEEMKLVDSKHGQLIKNFTILQGKKCLGNSENGAFVLPRIIQYSCKMVSVFYFFKSLSEYLRIKSRVMPCIQLHCIVLYNTIPIVFKVWRVRLQWLMDSHIKSAPILATEYGLKGEEHPFQRFLPPYFSPPVCASSCFRMSS